MAEIKERIEKIQGYFVEMQVTNVDGDNVIYVVVQFPQNWIISDDITEKFNVSVAGSNNECEYYFCADIATGFDKVFDAIDYNIQKMKDVQERAALLTQKLKELKIMFEDESITTKELKTLTFNYKANKDNKEKSVQVEQSQQKQKGKKDE